jgi:hypothetical protein
MLPVRATAQAYWSASASVPKACSNARSVASSGHTRARYSWVYGLVEA